MGGLPNLGPAPKSRDPEAIKRWLHKLSLRLGAGGSPTFESITLSGMDPDEIVMTDSSKKLISTDVLDFGSST